ncbi:MAG: hypothetical protein JNK15_04600, partial [Planctomycetes bacterium]|nr:hypothetical protein [Planctomycetota bacterium]
MIAVTRTLSTLGLLVAQTIAQCPTGSTLVSGGPACCPTGSVHAMVAWDPDGPGPLGQHLVCGGAFEFSGTIATANVALLDPATRSWTALGAGFDGPVFALAVSPTGGLVAAGGFSQSGTVATTRVARWSGTAWAPVGTGTNGDVGAAVFTPNGDLFVGGSFTTAGGVAAANIARWDGIAWSALGSGVTGVPPFPVPPPVVAPVSRLAARSNGDLIVAGAFTTAGNLAANGIARWNGSWSALVTGPFTAVGTALAVLANDDVVAGTDDFNGNCQALRWNGASWTPLGSTSASPWLAFCEQPNGQLLAERIDSFSGFADVQHWNGTAWSPAPSPFLFGPASALLTTGVNDTWMSGTLYGPSVPSVLRFDGQNWRAPADGLDGGVAGVVPFADGFAMGGYFRQVGSVTAEGIAVRQGGIWSALGAPIDGQVYALLAPRSGGLFVGGWFTVPSVPGSQNVVRWDGQQWQAMGTPPAIVAAFAEGPDGSLYCGGGFFPFVARWNGANWQTLGTLPTTGLDVGALAVLQNGDVVAGLRYDSGPLVQRWNGASWQPLGNGLAVGTGFDS